jgi:hypothetical protein
MASANTQRTLRRHTRPTRSADLRPRAAASTRERLLPPPERLRPARDPTHHEARETTSVADEAALAACAVRPATGVDCSHGLARYVLLNA